MAFIADLIGSLATYGGQMLAEERKSEMELERNKQLAEYRSGLEMTAQERLAKVRADIERENDRIKAELKAELENRARDQRKAALDGELSKIADQQVGQRFKTADESADTTGENYGNEVQRANGFIGQAQQEARANFKPTGDDYLRASINAGYGGEEKLATLDSSIDKQSIKTDAYLQVQVAKRELDLAKLEAQRAKSEGEHQAAMARVAVLQASLEAKMGNMGGSAQERNTNIINSANHTITTLGEKPRDPTAAKAWQEQYDAAVDLRKMAMDELRQKKSDSSGGVAIPPSAVAKLKENVLTTFAGGQVWTLKNGKPVQVK